MSNKKTTIDGNFSERLRELIEEKLKITQTEFAKKIGITSGYVSMVVTGKRGPSAELIAGIFINYSDYLPWLLNQTSGKKIRLCGERSGLKIIGELDEWISEEMKKNPKRGDWLEIQLQDALPTFKEWLRRKESGLDSGEHFPSSKVA